MRKFILDRIKIMYYMDTKHIYVEDIKKFFCIPKWFAKLLCEMAVKEGYFIKRISGLGEDFYMKKS